MRRIIQLGVIALLFISLPDTVEPAPRARKKKTNPDFVRILPGNERFIAIDKKNGFIAELGLPDMEVRKEFIGDDGRSIVNYGVSPDGKWLMAVYKKGHLWVWDIATGEEKIRMRIKVSAFAPLEHTFVPKKDWLIIYDPEENRISTWDIQSGTLNGKPFASLSTFGGKLALSPDGKHLALIGNLYYNYSSYNIGVFSYPDGRSLQRGSFTDLMLTGGQKGAMYTFDRFEVNFESDQTISLLVDFGRRNDQDSERHRMTASVPELNPIEDLLVDRGSVHQWSIPLSNNRKAVLQRRFGDIKTADHLAVIQLDGNGRSVDPVWRIFDQGYSFTSHDVSADAGWAVVGSKKTRSLYVYDASKLVKKEKTVSGNHLEWLEPALVKSGSMP